MAQSRQKERRSHWANLEACEVQDHFWSLLQSGDHADLTLKVGEQTFRVHKCIMSRCTFFANACKPGFREAESGVIEMPDKEPHVVKALIDFIYCGNYTLIPVESNEMSQAAIAEAKLYVLADEYILPRLKHIAAARFKFRVGMCMLLDSILKVVKGAYGCWAENPVLREILILHIASNFHEKLLTTQNAEHKQILHDYPDLVVDIAVHLSQTVTKLNDALSSGGLTPAAASAK